MVVPLFGFAARALGRVVASRLGRAAGSRKLRGGGGNISIDGGIKADISISGLGAAGEALNELGEKWKTPPSYVVGVEAQYAPYVEYGTSRTPSQPFMRIAARETAGQAKRIAAQSNDVHEFMERLALECERAAKRRAPVDTGYLRSSIAAHRR